MELKTKLFRFSDVFFSIWEKPLFGFGLSLSIYFYLNLLTGSAFALSDYPYYNYLADAFLHGQLYLRLLPDNFHDLVLYNGNYYLYWPPMPAIVLMPFIAVFGVGLTDAFFNAVIAALNVGIVAILLRKLSKRNIIPSTRTQRGILIVLLAIGSVHFPMAVGGTVWLTGQLIGFMFVALAYLAAVSLEREFAFFGAGLMIAAAMLTRNHLLFMGLWPGLFLVKSHWGDEKKSITRYILIGLLPVFIGGIAYLGYNVIRFGTPFEVGITYHGMNSIFRNSYETYGPFSLHYVPINFYYQYLYYPFASWPPTEELFMGGSLFLLSPLFLAAFWGIIKEKDRFNVWGLVLSILTTNILIITLMGTGWLQFGPRYTLDFTLALLLLTLMGIKYMRLRATGLLLSVSLAHYWILSMLKL